MCISRFPDHLYFGDEQYGNEVVDGIIGGSGGGRITIRSRHVDIDGEISVDGLPPDSRIGQGAGVYTGRERKGVYQMIIDLARRWINLHKRAMSISDCRSESFRSWKLKKMSIV